MDFMYRLSDQLAAFYNATNINIQIIDKNGNVIEYYGTPCVYCTIFQEACGKFCPCEQSHNYAFKEAKRLGDGYMFTCPAGYVHFALVITEDNKIVANILAGPIAVEYSDYEKIDKIIKKNDLSINYRGKLFQAYSAAPLIEPYRARYFWKLLSLLVANLNKAVKYDEQMEKTKSMQISKVGEYMNLLRDAGTMSLQYDMEKQLVEDVIKGNKEHAKSILNEMLGRIYFTSANNIEIIKARAIELIALLSRAVVENGGSETTVYEMTDSSLHNISNIKDLTELSYQLLEILDLFCNEAFSKYNKSDIPALRQAVSYIEKKYNTNLSLEEVAEHVGLNTAYFSTLFKKEIGVNFSGYVTERRMEAAKEMLKKTNMPLVEIAMSLGYNNQSYFSSVFKKYCNMTPKQYRFSD